MKQILSVSYDENLLMTRELMLRQAGYQVTSSLGFVEAIDRCNTGSFDLLILGHSIPHKDKQELITKFRKQCDAPVLVLKRHGEEQIEDVDFEGYPDNPADFMETVENVFSKGALARRQRQEARR